MSRLWYLSPYIRAVSPEPLLFAHMKYGDKGSDQKSSPTGWLHMYIWRMSLLRTKSAIISWHGSNDEYDRHWHWYTPWLMDKQKESWTPLLLHPSWTSLVAVSGYKFSIITIHTREVGTTRRQFLYLLKHWKWNPICCQLKEEACNLIEAVYFWNHVTDRN